MTLECVGDDRPPCHLFTRTSGTNLHILSLNARSLCNKIHSFFALVAFYKPDIVAVTETWLRSDIPGLFVEGYSCFRGARPSGVGGGTLLLVLNSLSPVEVSLLDKESCNFQDSTWCTVTCPNFPDVLVGCIYRSPSSPLENNLNLNKLLSNMCNLSDSLKIIVGDFNFPDVNWDLFSGVSASESFRDVVNDCYLTQLVHQPTRGSSILDLVFTNDPSVFEEVEVIEPLLGSDHKAVLCKLSCSSQNPVNKEVQSYDFRRADWTLFVRILKNVRWDEMFSNLDPDVMWNFLKNNLLHAASQAIPRSRPLRKFCGINVCGKVKRALNARRKLYKRYRNCSKDYASEMLQVADERLRVALTEARVQYERNIAVCLKDSPRHFWKHIHRSLGSKPHIGSVIAAKGSLTTNDQETADEFNKFFASVFVEDLCESLPSLPDRGIFSLDTVNVNVHEIHKILKTLPLWSSPGPDGIPNHFLINAVEVLGVVLRRFFQFLFDNGVMPSDWCLANVTPVFKKGNRTLCSNYRPISLTSTCCKVAERVLKSNILKFIEENNLLSSTQHGFLPRRSCLSSLLQFFEFLTSNLDVGVDCSAVYIDFAKAFDSVPHRLLLYKLKSFGISGALLAWIECFLTGRKQRVVIRGQSSPWFPVLSGVPQGSVLGPLLFVLYIDDIDSCFLHSTVLKYADDVKVISALTSENSGQFLQCDLDRLMEWSRQ